MTAPTPTADLTSVEGHAADALAAVLRVERLLAQKRQAYAAAHAAAAPTSSAWVAYTQAMIDAAGERLEKEGLSRYAV